MIDLFKIQIAQLIQKRAEVNEQTLPKEKVAKALRVQRYATSIFPINSLENNASYIIHSYEENTNYLTAIFNYLFDNIYTTQERSVFILFALMRINNNFVLSNEMLQIIPNIINLTSEKIDIQYYIDEIKFKYLLHLTLAPETPENQQLIERLMTELAAIEDAHNQINLDERLIE